jgi:xylan 1,4-beta-xylosidase
MIKVRARVGRRLTRRGLWPYFAVEVRAAAVGCREREARPIHRQPNGGDRGVVTVDESGQEHLGRTERLRLGLGIDGPVLRFRYDTGTGWRPFGPLLDATVLSDEHAEEMDGGQIRALGFTGAFVGLWAWDLTGGGFPADFDEATYRIAPADAY